MCFYRLTVNVWTERGLTNGAEGEVFAIIYEPGCGPPALPCCIIATFEGKALLLFIITLRLCFTFWKKGYICKLFSNLRCSFMYKNSCRLHWAGLERGYTKKCGHHPIHKVLHSAQFECALFRNKTTDLHTLTVCCCQNRPDNMTGRLISLDSYSSCHEPALH